MEYIGAAWDVFMEQIISKYESQRSKDFEIYLFGIKLKKLLRQKSSFFWNIKFFRKYIAKGINPLGLRVQVFPDKENIDDAFKQRWEKVLIECTENMMLLLCKHYSKKIEQVDAEIAQLYAANNGISDTDAFLQKEKEIEDDLEGFIEKIIVRKEKKFQRDQLAFSLGKAYRWPTVQQHNMSEHKEYDLDSASQISSAFSLSSLLRAGPTPRLGTNSGQSCDLRSGISDTESQIMAKSSRAPVATQNTSYNEGATSSSLDSLS